MIPISSLTSQYYYKPVFGRRRYGLARNVKYSGPGWNHTKWSHGFGILLFLMIRYSGLQAQDAPNQYGLLVINSIEKLRLTIDADSNKRFVHIKDYVPGVALDIKYATTQNVFYEQLYNKPYAITRLPVARALARVQAELKNKGFGLKIYDAYRPYSTTCRMWDLLPDSIYMGKPWRGSKHNRGIAIDLTLIDLYTGKELKMPTPYDALVYASHPDFNNLADTILRNRNLLILTMQKFGFKVAKNEWWHFDYLPGVDYELLDIPHRDIIRKTIRKYKK